jgi:hypothetical protein
MPWGLLKNVGIFLAKAIAGVELANPAPGNGAVKKSIVEGLLDTFLSSLIGPIGSEIFHDPEVLAAYTAANDALVHFQNVLAKAHAAKGSSIAEVTGYPIATGTGSGT